LSALAAVLAAISAWAIPVFIVGVTVFAAARGVKVFPAFIEGAKQGFEVAVRIIPYLVAILVAVGALRASGVLDAVLGAIRGAVGRLGVDARWVDAMPVALIKPLSGGGARGLMVETMKTMGADSFAGRLACVIQGSTETTFYVLAVYFGSIGVKKTRHALLCGLASELAGVTAAIFVSYVLRVNFRFA
jgi:spore maturation protein SpmB